ncbi:ATP-binding protein [Ramlibacter sp.]|uniref:ATP-binding protein n=1 Tax=Ramlibacter sp. TaxID=1917967 RepID=UPI002627A6AD|nr:ATP-binding protein [Ramlibacter sp.]
MRPNDILRWIAFAATYFAVQAVPTALYGDNPALRGANVVGVFVLLLAPRRHWFVLAPMLWLAAGAARELAGAPQPWLVGGCNALEVLAVAAALHGRHGLSSPWYGSAQLPRLLLAALAVPIASGAAAAAAIHMATGVPFAPQWATWYLASMLAYVTLTPLLLEWRAPAPVPTTGAPRLALWRRVAGVAVITVACVALLRQPVYAPLLLLSFPLVVVCTWRYRLLGVTATIAFLSILGGWFAARNVGALFQFLPPGSGMAARVQALQLFLGATVLCSLPFAVLRAELERLLVQLRRKSDARAEFLAAMSHEIRTPMTGVLGMADLLATQPLTAEQRRYVDTMRASGRHLVNVINDILDFSRIETGKLTLEAIDFHMDEMLEQVRSLINPMALEKGLAFSAQLAPGTPAVVRGDPTRLRQILLNLAGNAVKFTSQGSATLQVDGQADAAGRVHYRFEVRDTGIGIAADKLQILFTPFTQADGSTARQYGGSGLGLAISRRLAEAMGGRITVASTPGLGSVFTLELPLEAGDPAHHTATVTQALQAASPQRILVAEDVQVNRDILQLALGARGHHVVFAHDGAAALQAVQAQPFELVLMDVQMPVMDGVEATRRIRALPGDLGRIPIIGLTANVMSQEQARYLQAGMDECLMKPIEWDRLDAAIARHASGGGRQSAVRAASAPEDAHSARPLDLPLLDAPQIASLRSLGSEAEFRLLMRNIIESVQRTVDEIGVAATAAAIGAAAHRLRGSAGMGGLGRVSALAGALEDACADSGQAGDWLPQLVDSVRDTRAALAAGGMTAEPELAQVDLIAPGAAAAAAAAV